MQITKEQLQTIVDNAPPGTDKVGVIKGLYDRGVTVKGVDSYDAQKFISDYSANKTRQTQSVQEPEQRADDNLGTGFTPTFESKPEDTTIETVGKTVGNVPRSAFQLGKDVFTAVTNPVQTVKTVGNLLKGTGGKIGEKALDTDIGQSLLERISEFRVKNGLQPLEADASGKLKAPATEEMEMVNKVGEYFTARYGSLDKFKASAVEDPVGVLSDIASVVSGVGFGVKQTGNASRLGKVADVGQTIQKIGDAIEPVTAVTRGTGTVVGAVGETTPARMLGEALPTARRIAEGEVVKALDLTQGDISRITQKTGNNVTDFMVRNNVFKETPEEIVLALDDLKTQRMAEVRVPIQQVQTVYSPADVPRVRDALTTVQNSISDVPGLEDVASEVNALLNKPNYTLSDVQRAKEILDQNSSIFNRMGDARQTATAEGLANIRAELKLFIEDEVLKATNGQVDIRSLNNDVATAVEIAEAVESRATRGLTRQGLSVFDGILGFSAAAAFDPITALGVVGIKKLSQTPSFRIALARTLSATPVTDLNKWAGEIASNNISPATRQAITQIIETSRQNAQFIESGSQIVEEAQPTDSEVMQ